MIRPTPIPRESFELEDVLWLMHCAEGPVPLSSSAAIKDFLEREIKPWDLSWEDDFLGLPRRLKEAGARLVGGRPEDMSLVPTTTAGLVAVAQGLHWQEGDGILVPLGEFPSNAWPWRALASRGVRFREVPLWPGHRAGEEAWETAPPPADVDPEARLLEAVTPKTRLLSVSWVRFQDGLRLDLARLGKACRERGVLLVVDGIQGAGTLPLNLDGLPGVAAFASGGHKGLLAPQGLGILWTAPELRSKLVPPGGWLSVEGATDFRRPSTDFDRDWLPEGDKLEQGVPNLVGCAALASSLELIHRAGLAEIEEHVAWLAMRFLHGLSQLSGWQKEADRLAGLLDAGRLGSIFALHHGGRGFEALQSLLEDGFEERIYASVREGYFRIAFHGWHTAEDVDRLLAWLREASGP